jgi:F0F1-type ATP synthase epsilon subunit
VSEEGCTILSDHILDMAALYPNAAEEALAAARDALAKADTEQERMEAQKQLMNAEALSLAIAA